jgi:shikimate 5-dehydrogenase
MLGIFEKDTGGGVGCQVRGKPGTELSTIKRGSTTSIYYRNAERMFRITHVNRRRSGNGQIIHQDKNAVIFGVGGAVARAFAREGARVFLSGRNAAPVEAVANDIAASGGVVETATVDVLKRNGG